MRRDDPEAQVSMRGEDAQRVLENPAYQHALDSLRADVIAAWKACPIRDGDGQRLYLQLAKMVDKFDAILRDYVEAGRYVDMKKVVDDSRNEGGVRRALRKVI
jgi:hypothetical protein